MCKCITWGTLDRVRKEAPWSRLARLRFEIRLANRAIDRRGGRWWSTHFLWQNVQRLKAGVDSFYLWAAEAEGLRRTAFTLRIFHTSDLSSDDSSTAQLLALLAERQSETAPQPEPVADALPPPDPLHASPLAAHAPPGPLVFASGVALT